MGQQLDRETLNHILQAEDVETLSSSELVGLFQEEAGFAGSIPDGVWQIDPRNGDRILFNPSRARRPYDMMLLVRDAGKKYLHGLSEAEIAAVAQGWHDAIRAIRWIMPRIGREIAYNVIAHNGPGAGLHFEFLPYTQETGGFEHLGLFVCQENPATAAAQIRKYLEQRPSET